MDSTNLVALAKELMAKIPKPPLGHDEDQKINTFSDEGFINKFHISKDTFFTVLEIIQNEIAPFSNWKGAITGTSKLLLTMRYLTTGTLDDITCIDYSLAFKHIHEVCQALAKKQSKFICFPTNAADTSSVMTQFYDLCKFPSVIGAVDCTHIKIESPGGDDEESFRNKKGYFSINTQCICSPSLQIMDIVARWPGSWDDQLVFDNSSVEHKFETGVLKGYLLGDGGYEVRPYLMTPLLNPATESEKLYNESHNKTRIVIERCFEALKQRFPVLSKGITFDLINSRALIVACAVIHNISIDKQDGLPNNIQHYDDYYNNDNIAENNVLNVEGREARDDLIRNHFAKPE